MTTTIELLESSEDAIVQRFHELTNWGPEDGARAVVDIQPKTYPRFHAIELSYDAESSNLRRLLRKRRSIREFGDTPLSSSQINAFVDAFRGDWNSQGRFARHIPSAGGLSSTEIYLLSKELGSFSANHIGPGRRSLETLWAIPEEQMLLCFARDEWVCRAPLVLIITGRMGSAIGRYGIRGYRFVVLEAGSAAMVASLVALEEQLASCIVGGFDDSALAAILDLPFRDAEVPLIAVAIGHVPKGCSSLCSHSSEDLPF